jgi:phosphatidylglycerol---prolipoprotein diacylglyceryl transferase
MKSIVLSVHTAQTVHLLLEWVAIAVGVQLYQWQKKIAAQSSLGKQDPAILAESNFSIVLGCILGAALGNKLVFWLEFPHLWNALHHDFTAWMSGQSIVGGLLGGLLGVELAKKIKHQKSSTGDQFVLPLIVSTLIGRVGCFLAGLNDGTFGNPTALPWGVDFGDGISRHPTQIYDMVFVLLWGGLLLLRKNYFAKNSGLMFKAYLAGYLSWRFIIDAYKPIPYEYFYHLSGIQVVCIVALILYLPFLFKQIYTRSHYVGS